MEREIQHKELVIAVNVSGGVKVKERIWFSFSRLFLLRWTLCECVCAAECFWEVGFGLQE